MVGVNECAGRHMKMTWFLISQDDTVSTERFVKAVETLKCRRQNKAQKKNPEVTTSDCDIYGYKIQKEIRCIFTKLAGRWKPIHRQSQEITVFKGWIRRLIKKRCGRRYHPNKRRGQWHDLKQNEREKNDEQWFDSCVSNWITENTEKFQVYRKRMRGFFNQMRGLVLLRVPAECKETKEHGNKRVPNKKWRLSSWIRFFFISNLEQSQFLPISTKKQLR